MDTKISYNIDEQPIVALSTPQGSGALAIIRISGCGAIEIASNIAQLPSKKKLASVPTHTIHYGSIINHNQTIDTVLFFVMRAPKTFTGQDTVEISCHNNQFIINQIVQLAIAYGAHHAKPGEFTRRAVLNKKIDIIQAEAINDLISAQNEVALKKSLSQLQGSLSSHLKKIENELIAILGLVEASFEFLDEEQKDIDLDNLIMNKIQNLLDQTDQILKNFNQQQQIRKGLRITLLGSPNVGKSTLFNALVKSERAIVTNMPGTTRDAIETTCYKNGNFWLLVDTAGLRATQDIVEQQGVDRSWQEAAQSDIILLILDATTQYGLNPSVAPASRTTEDVFYKRIQEQYPEKIVMVANKIDLCKETNTLNPPAEDCLQVSAKNKTGIKELEYAIKQKINKLLQSSNTPYLLNKRQYDLILEINTKLKQLKKKNSKQIHHEIMAHHLKQLNELVSELMGKTINEKVMDSVFNSFCIGK